VPTSSSASTKNVVICTPKPGALQTSTASKVISTTSVMNCYLLILRYLLPVVVTTGFLLLSFSTFGMKASVFRSVLFLFVAIFLQCNEIATSAQS